MSKSVRFLGVAICAWAGVRAISLGMVPPLSAMAFDLESAKRRPLRLPPVQPTILPPIEPAEIVGSRRPEFGAFGTSGGFLPYPVPAFQPYPIYVPVPANGPMRSAPPQIIYASPTPAGPHQFNIYGSSSPAMAASQQLAMVPQVSTPPTTPSFRTSAGEPDRLSLSGWALMRGKGGPDSLTGNGMLGGSEAGGRLMWHFDPRLAATFRASVPINTQRGMEVALGLRYQPFADWPAAITLERRRGLRDYGRDAFALFAEGGAYAQPLPWQFSLDGYFQAGLIDLNHPDWFADVQLAATRPIWRGASAGFGIWGAGQPGLKRLDAGPRVSIKIGGRARVNLDYRLNLAGNARPGSGAAVTLAGDF